MAPPRSTDFKSDTYKRMTSILKNRLQSIKASVDAIYSQSEPLSVVQRRKLSMYLSEIESKKSEFESLVNRALTLNEEEELSNDNISQDQDEILELTIHISSHIDALTCNEPANNLEPQSDSSVSNSSQLRLPKLDLPKFNGDLTSWTSFINLFDTTIHTNASIPEVLKFQYLLSVLQGEPFNLVKSLNLTAENYSIAYNLLHDRYHNIRRLQSLHLNQLLDLPSISASHIQSVRQFINTFSENSQALSALGCPIHNSDPLLASVLLRKMDIELKKRLEAFRSTNLGNSSKHTLPEVKEIIDFLTTECNNIEDATLNSISYVTKGNIMGKINKASAIEKSNSSRKAINFMVTEPSESHQQSSCSFPTCFVCDQASHKVYTCSVFKKMTPHERYQFVKSKRHCVSCLGSHDLRNCQSLSTCRTCHKRHHTLLHFNDNSPSQPQASSDPKLLKSNIVGNANTKDKVSVTMTSNDFQSTSTSSATTVLLGTLLVQLRSSDGVAHVFRALLDSGSMCDLISENAVNILNTRRHRSDIHLTGINQSETRNKGQIFVDVETLSGQLIVPNHPLLILDKLTLDLPRVPISADVLRLTQRFNLADPQFHVPGRIDVILGVSLFSQLLTQEHHSLGPHMPSLLGTRFGHVVIGTAPTTLPLSSSSDKSSNLNICLHSATSVDLHESIQRFWQQEELPVCPIKTLEDDLCEKHFANTHTRDENGRYVVRLPFKNSDVNLGSSRHAAENRLIAMERKFKGNERFSTLYHEFMGEYIDLGHMSLCTNDVNGTPHYFLPHHGVLKENSSSTKLRTVFDASCKSSSGVSLNDTLLTGRKLQTNICDLLMSFRRHNVVFCCDIRQMYRQILVNPDDRNFQLILWRNHSTDPISTYQLNTVTYGMNSSPYLAIRTLHQLAEDEGGDFPEAAHILKHHTYVDDIIAGAANEEDALKLQSQIISLLGRGGFELRKWVSNSPQLLHSLPNNHLETPTFLQDSQTPHFTVLGLHWSPDKDVFSYNFNVPSNEYPTKRNVLSVIAKIYDPCGFLTPFIMLTKCFMQLLWSKGLSWDEHLPSDIAPQWKLIIKDIACVKNLTISRALPFSSACNIETHGFCDASESGYAAIVYLRCELPDNRLEIKPIIAKSRVAPLKRVTIPRLELCAAYLLAQLVSHCQKVFPSEINNENIFLWCDSTVVLSWLHTPSYRLKTYVANRVARTQELVPADSWKHVSSDQNPADCASRGLLMSQLYKHQLWWNGPGWLRLPHDQWPVSTYTQLTLDSSHELKETPLTVFTTSQSKEWFILSKYSSWNTLVHVMAMALRFCNNCRSPDRRVGHLTIDELRCARNKIFFVVQQSSFAAEFHLLTNKQDCTKRIQRLNPFLDDNGLIRVGGRLTNSSLGYDAKHPILLPKQHHVVDLYIDYFHKFYLHAGPQLLQSLLRQQVWILCSRNTIRSRIHKCITCFKQRPTNVTPLMGDLPPSRITPARPFSSTGVDYGGPYTIKMLNFRFIKCTKVYISIFICLVTKAVHIEVVTDLTTESFIAALQRFVSRRGMCADLHSDCATTFIGANAALKKIIQSSIHNCTAQDKILRFANTQGIRFHFNPPAAPHHGGLWESAIKNAKHHLHRVIGNHTLTLPEFITLTVRVEAMLNSRPLTSLSNDPSDLTALTPGHFLVGGPLVSITEPDLTQIPQNRLKHWHLTQQLYQRIWQRWSLEYLHTLQQRTKWTKKGKNLKIGDLVLVHSSSSPLNWPLARIVSIHPGNDSVVRVVTIKTSSGTFVRPATKVFPLPITE